MENERTEGESMITKDLFYFGIVNLIGLLLIPVIIYIAQHSPYPIDQNPYVSGLSCASLIMSVNLVFLIYKK